MSVGHHHKEPNLFAETPRIRATLHKLLTSGMAPQLMRRWRNVDFDSDVPYLAGYNVFGTTKLADRDFIHALYDSAYAEHLIGEPIDTGLSPEDTLECIFTHEETEKVILDDPSNPIDLYDHVDEPGGFGAHEYATFAEHEKVRAKGGTPHRYERGLDRIIKFCGHKQIHRIPKDYACAPYLDDTDSNTKRILRRLQELGVEDAFKASKERLEYAQSNGTDRCAGCAHWQGAPGPLSTCGIADGLVGADRWCKSFEPKAKGDILDLPGSVKEWRGGPSSR